MNALAACCASLTSLDVSACDALTVLRPQPDKEPPVIPRCASRARVARDGARARKAHSRTVRRSYSRERAADCRGDEAAATRGRARVRLSARLWRAPPAPAAAPAAADLVAAGAPSVTSLTLARARALCSAAPAALPALTALNLSSCELLADLRPLASCAHLAALVVDGCARLRTLAGLGRPPLNLALRSLSARECGALAGIAALARCRALEACDVRGCGALRERVFRPLLCCPRLRSVRVTHSGYSLGTASELTLLHSRVCDLEIERAPAKRTHPSSTTTLLHAWRPSGAVIAGGAGDRAATTKEHGRERAMIGETSASVASDTAEPAADTAARASPPLFSPAGALPPTDSASKRVSFGGGADGDAQGTRDNGHERWAAPEITSPALTLLELANA